MSDHAYLLVAAIVLLVMALSHLFRIVLGTPIIVQGVSIPVWASATAFVVTGFLPRGPSGRSSGDSRTTLKGGRSPWPSWRCAPYGPPFTAMAKGNPPVAVGLTREERGLEEESPDHMTNTDEGS